MIHLVELELERDGEERNLLYLGASAIFCEFLKFWVDCAVRGRHNRGILSRDLVENSERLGECDSLPEFWWDTGKFTCKTGGNFGNIPEDRGVEKFELAQEKKKKNKLQGASTDI